jgi:hypothetical protein
MKREDLITEKHLYVVVLRSATILSKMIHAIKGAEYTHAALALDAPLEYMFSFGRRRAANPFIGCFKRERIGDELYRSCSELPGAVIEIAVSDTQYRSAAALINSFILNSHIYGYNYFGLIGNLCGRSRSRNTRFFCSEFVYYVLRKSGVCNLGKPQGLVCPQDLLAIKGSVIFRGDLKEYVCPAKGDIAGFSRLFSIQHL